MRHILLRLSTCLTLFFLFPALGWAQSPGDVPSGGLLLPPPGDQSVIYLGYIFGVVGNLIHGTGSQIMGHMFAQFNSAVLALGGLIVTYTTVLGIANTAHEGEFLGKKYSSFFIPFRTVLGIMLIVPTASGYSWIQIIAMWVVLQGVTTANMVWHAAVQYLLNGGVIIVQNQDINSTTGQKVRTEITSLSQATTCLRLLQNMTNQLVADPSVTNPVPTTSLLNSVLNTMPAPDPNPHSTSYVLVRLPNFDQKSDPYWAPFNGVCGELGVTSYNSTAVRQALLDLYSSTAPLSGACDAAFYQKDPANPGYWTKKPGLPPGISIDSTCSTPDQCLPNGMVGTSLSDAQVNPYNIPGVIRGTIPVVSWCNPINQASIANMDQSINMATMDYLGLTYETTHNPSSIVNAKDLKDVVGDDPTISSWFNAGAYYFALLQASEGGQLGGSQHDFVIDFDNSPLTSSQGNSTLKSLASTVGASLPDQLNISNKGINTIPNNLQGFVDFLKEWLMPFFAAKPDTPNGLMAAFLSLQKPAQNIGHEDVKVSHTDFSQGKDTSSVIHDISGPGSILYGAFDNLITAQQTNSSPMIIMMDFGAACIQFALNTWISLIVIYTALTAVYAAVPSVALGVITNVLGIFYAPLVTILLTPLLVNGAMLLFYMPAVPFMIFTFGTIGWIIGVIEAMIAAPIVGFAIMHPEGSDVFGKGDAGLMLMLNLFLRPPLMIFGLIAGIMISSIGVWIINQGFSSGVVVYIQNIGPGWQTGAIAYIALPILYMMMVLQVINRSFTLIYNFPDKITQWISGGLQQSLGQEMSSAEKEARSGMEGHMKTAGEFKAGTASAAKGAGEGEQNRALSNPKVKGARSRFYDKSGQT